ncbi:small subunit processome component 20 homolog, partial [Plakobranchus ocellatus]
MGKSSKHKAENVHHFISFSERISNVNIDVIHQIRRVDDETEGTYFGEALAKWTELDLTDHYCNFRKEISSQVQTYEQLVHHKDDILSSLKEHLSVPNSVALSALLDLLVQLAKDLQQDFVPHFQDFFKLLTHILTTRVQDADAMEQTFQALASLFRVLWRFLIKDFKEVFSYYSHLLTTSQKDYIKVFAAESCAYLLRKVKRQDKLLNFLFGNLKTSPELTEGIGLLLFEMVKGVKNHFHTISEQVFPLLLQKLGPWHLAGKKQANLPRQHVEQAVTICLQECAEHISKENSQRLWEILMDCISNVNKACKAHHQEAESNDKKSGSGICGHLCRLLRILCVLINHKNGDVIWDCQLIANTLCLVAGTPGVEQDVLNALYSLLDVCHESLSVETIVKIMTSVFAAQFKFLDLKAFAMSCINKPFFEKDVLSRMIQSLNVELSAEDGTQNRKTHDEGLSFLAEVVLQKTASPITGDGLKLLKLYPLDRSWTKNKHEKSIVLRMDTLLSQTLENKDNLTMSDLVSLWGCVICLPHLSIDNSMSKCARVWKHVFKHLNSKKETKLNDAIMQVLNQVLKSMIFIALDAETDTLPVKNEDIYKILELKPSSPIALQILDFYLSFQGNADLLTEELLRSLYPQLESNLVSPSHIVRLLTCHILSLFPFKMKDYGDDVVRDSAFTVMFTAEQMKPTVHNYRDKLIYLRKMEHDFANKCLPEGISVKACLLFTLGNEFWNFKLLWEPLGAIIASFASSMETKEFWDTMLTQLKRAASECEKELHQLPSELTLQESEASGMLSVFQGYWAEALTDGRPPDFLQFRSQLWKALKRFPEKCVLRSDELCQLYLQFLRNEFISADEDTQSFQNIFQPPEEKEIKGSKLVEESMDTDVTDPGSITTVNETENNDRIEDDINSDEEDEDDDENECNKSGVTSGGEKAGRVKKKSRVQSLLAHLDVFAQFKKQRSMFNQKDVQDTFFDFLKHRNAAIQKASFDCIMTYKSPHLLPYRENFYRLLDDKTFKSEITLFSVDEENSQVKSEDREGLLPVLMRILYGKMHGKTGNNTAGKANSNIRRTIVFGFLSGCQPHELRCFLDLLFQPCLKFVTDDPVKMVSETKATLDLSKMIPLKRMKGILNTLQTVSRRWGHRLGEFSHCVLHMLIGLASMLDVTLAQRHLVVPGTIRMLKSLRHTAINRITQFFEAFDHLDYTAGELEAIFQAVVWPQAEKLVYEGVHHPTPLLKLLLFWSQHSRFLPMLGYKQQKEDSKTVTALGCVLDLLNAPTVSKTVCLAILEMLTNILQDEEEREEKGEDLTDADTKAPLPEPFVFPAASDSDSLNPLDSLLLPYVPKLLNYLKNSLGKMTQSAKDKKSIYVVELKILAKMSRLVTTPEDCHILCDLLVPYLSRGASLTQEIEENILISLTNLMQYNEQPYAFIRPVAQLFSIIERRQSRNVLCKLFSIICERDEDMKNIAALVEKLNAWDKRRAEEPDYMVRLAAFTEINTLVAKPGELPLNILLPVIYNSCHFIYAIDDLSIRDNSTNCLIKIVERLSYSSSKSTEEKRVFISIVEQTLVPQVKLGIRHKSEAVRHEFLAVLQSLVIHCKNHPMFEGLSDLCDKDPEADFFENIRHIQMHKRSRALRRLYRHLKDHRFHASVHMSYVVPLIYTFVTDSSYSKHANVQDAAIDLLGAVCRQLSWPYYLQMLRFYLKLLTKKPDLQRQIIRIIVALLDAFHFDLSNSTYKVRNMPKVMQKSVTSADDPNPETKVDEMEPHTKTEKGNNSLGEVQAIEESPEEQELKEEDEFPSADLVGDEEQGTEEVMEIVGEETNDKTEGVGKRKVICSAPAATRIHKTISVSLIPQLHKVITQRTKSDDEHKLAKTKYAEDEEILRVPIALALIKLLQSLPKGTLEYTLPGVLLKICNFLKSRSRDVRTTARETLEKVAVSLGCRYFPFIIREMRAVLTRGYQLHVLSFTVHYLLKSLAEIIKPGDLDPALSSIQDVFYAELFGHVAEEKEVEAIRAKYFEAKFIKGYDAYGILARCVSSEKLDRLILPVKNVLETTYNQRTANKAETLLLKVATGLSNNSSIPLETMMVFIHSLTTSQMQQDKQEQDNRSAKEDMILPGPLKKMPESCLLLEQAAPRGGLKPKATKKTNIHLLIEFGLQLLYTCLKKESLSPTEHAHLQMLDPMVPMMKSFLTDIHVKTSANAMRCLSWLLRFPLPSLKKNIKRIAEGMFIVLQNYAGASTAKGGNQELITMCFKAVTVLVRDVSYHQISEQQLQVLLTYCEEDLYSHARQSTAFGLIRAILSRKLDIPQLHQTSDGRRSALEMMIAMFTAFPT